MVLSFPLFPFYFFPFSLFPNWCAINVNFHVYCSHSNGVKCCAVQANRYNVLLHVYIRFDLPPLPNGGDAELLDFFPRPFLAAGFWWLVPDDDVPAKPPPPPPPLPVTLLEVRSTVTGPRDGVREVVPPPLAPNCSILVAGPEAREKPQLEVPIF